MYTGNLLNTMLTNESATHMQSTLSNEISNNPGMVNLETQAIDRELPGLRYESLAGSEGIPKCL